MNEVLGVDGHLTCSQILLFGYIQVMVLILRHDISDRLSLQRYDFLNPGFFGIEIQIRLGVSNTYFIVYE